MECGFDQTHYMCVQFPVFKIYFTIFSYSCPCLFVVYWDKALVIFKTFLRVGVKKRVGINTGV